MRELEHPCKQEIQAIRKIILGVNPKITEEIKWNAPSFALGEHFVTFNGWAKDYVQLIFHHGPKKTTSKGKPINDPDGLLEWLATDRASMRFEGMKDVRGKKSRAAEDREAVDQSDGADLVRCDAGASRRREGNSCGCGHCIRSTWTGRVWWRFGGRRSWRRRCWPAETRGYKHHPQLKRFQDSPHPRKYIAEYLKAVHAEGEQRGYHFDATKIGDGGKVGDPGCDRGPVGVRMGAPEAEVARAGTKVAARTPRRGSAPAASAISSGRRRS